MKGKEEKKKGKEIKREKERESVEDIQCWKRENDIFIKRNEWR